MKDLKVFLSPLAAKKLEDTLDHIRHSWFEQVKDEFLERFKAVVDRNTSFIYRIKKDSIEIITVFDNRQNPDDIESEIKEVL